MAGSSSHRPAGGSRPVLHLLQPHGHSRDVGDDGVCPGQPAGVAALAHNGPRPLARSGGSAVGTGAVGQGVVPVVDRCPGARLAGMAPYWPCCRQARSGSPVKIDGSSILAFIAGFLLGSAPLWLYNVMTGGTLTSFGRNAVVTEHGVNNLNILSNLAAAVTRSPFCSTAVIFGSWASSLPITVNVIGFPGALLVIAVVLVRRQPEWRAGLGLVGTLIVTSLWRRERLHRFRHLGHASVYPVAAAADADRRWPCALLLIALAAWAALAANGHYCHSPVRRHGGQLPCLCQLWTALVRSGGLSRFSDAITTWRIGWRCNPSYHGLYR